METRTYTVPDVTCAHCERAISMELEALEGVRSVAVDVEQRRVVVSGERLDEPALLAAIASAGYEARPAGI